MQKEYKDFITEFIGRANSDQYEFHAVKEQVYSLQNQLREKERFVKTKDEEVAKSKKELLAAKNGNIVELQRLQKELNDQKLSATNLQNELTDVQNVLKATILKQQDTTEINELKKELANAKAKLSSADEHSKEAAKLAKELAQYKQKLSELEGDNAVKLAEVEKSLKLTQEALEAAQRVTASLESEKSELIEREKEICAQLDELTNELNIVSNQRVEKENIVQKSDEELKLRQENEGLIEENNALIKQNESCMASINKLNSELRKVFDQGDEYRLEVNDL